LKQAVGLTAKHPKPVILKQVVGLDSKPHKGFRTTNDFELVATGESSMAQEDTQRINLET